MHIPHASIRCSDPCRLVAANTEPTSIFLGTISPLFQKLHTLAKTLSLLGLSLGVSSCTDSTSPDVPPHPPAYDLIGVAGVRTERSATDSTILAYRAPRSLGEFQAQVSAGLWSISVDSLGRRLYTAQHFTRISQNFQARCWAPFFNGTVTFTQANGSPEELVLALKAPSLDSVALEYKVAYSRWLSLRRGKDYEVLGLDSLRIASASVSPIPRDFRYLVGVSLLDSGRNFLSEGENSVFFRIRRGKDTLNQREFKVRYLILGLSMYESDSLGTQIEPSKGMFYRTSAWGSEELRSTHLFLGKGSRPEVQRIRVARSTSELGRRNPDTDSNMYILPKRTDCSTPQAEGWCLVPGTTGSLVRVTLARSLFGPIESPAESGRAIFLQGRFLVTPGFAPDDIPFYIQMPFGISP